MLNINKPSTGETIAFICVPVILGIKKPFVVEAISTTALGDALSLLNANVFALKLNVLPLPIFNCPISEPPDVN